MIAELDKLNPYIRFDGTYEYCQGQRNDGGWENLKSKVLGVKKITGKLAIEYEGNLGAEAGFAFVNGTTEVKLQLKGSFDVGFEIKSTASPSARAPKNKPQITVFVDPTVAFTFGGGFEVQSGFSIAGGYTITTEFPLNRAETILTAGFAKEEFPAFRIYYFPKLTVGP